MRSFSYRTPTEAAANRLRRFAAASVAVSLRNAILFISDAHRSSSKPAPPLCCCLGGRLFTKCDHFHIGRPQKQQQTGSAALLLPRWPSLYEMRSFSYRTPTEAAANRLRRFAAASVAVSLRNAI